MQDVVVQYDEAGCLGLIKSECQVSGFLANIQNVVSDAHDSEKSPYMFGTLENSLPWKHEGGMSVSPTQARQRFS